MYHVPFMLIILMGLCLWPCLTALFLDHFVIDLGTDPVLCMYLEWYKSRLGEKKPASASELAEVML